jgi:hypothetical protein
MVIASNSLYRIRHESEHDEYTLCADEMNNSNQPVFIAANVEHDPGANFIRGGKRSS